MGAMLWWNSALSMQMLVRGYLAYQFTDSFVALGVINLVSAIPMLLFAPLGGVIADRSSRRVALQVGLAFSLAVAAVIGALLFAGKLALWHLVVSSLLQGVTMALVLPPRQALLPEVVERPLLMNAVSLQAACMNLTQVVGPAVGGFLIDWIGAAWVYAITVVLYAGSIALLFGVAKTRPGAARSAPAPAEGAGVAALGGEESAAPSALGDLAAGARYLRSDLTVLSVLSLTFVGNALGMPIMMLLPGYVAEVFDDAGSTLGLMQMGMGLGALLGSLLLATLRVRRHRGLLLAASALLMGVCMMLFSAVSLFWIAWTSLLLVGIGSGGRQTLSHTLVQEYVEDAYRGRVMSILTMQLSLMSIATFVVSLYVDQVGPRVAVASLGVALIAATLAHLVLLPRLRRLD